MAARENYGTGGLVRLTSWATAAAIAMTIAALASLSPAGSQRSAIALAALTGADAPRATMQLAAQRAGLERDRRSLNEAIRLLAADRDRLHNRVVSLERNLDDITGSIKSQPAARPMPEGMSLPPPPAARSEELPQIVGTAPAKPDGLPDWLANAPGPWPDPSSAMEFAPAPAAKDPEQTEPAAAPVQVTALPAEPQPQAPTSVTRTEFGVDIGGAPHPDELRPLWNTARARHGRLVGKLRPVIIKRQDRAGNPDYRLVIGPLANAAAAARLCVTLAAADVMCSTRAYRGERLTP